MNRKHAGVLKREGLLFVYSEQKTTAGLSIQQDDAVAVSVTDHEGIGAALLAALDAYKENVPHPDFKNFKPLEAHKRLLSLAGVRSMRAFYSKAKLLTVTTDRDTILLEPWRAEGKVSEFAQLTEKVRQVPKVTMRELGEAVVAAFNDAE